MPEQTQYTWGTFTAAVYALLPVDYDREGASTPLGFILRQAVSDIQNRIEYFRQGHKTTYSVIDVIEEGEASRGYLPEFCNPEGAVLIQVAATKGVMPLRVYDWANHDDLRGGQARIDGLHGWISWNARSREFYVYPQINEEWNMLLTWNGIKTEFDDTDYVPFDEDCVMACYYRLKAYIAQEIDRDMALAAANLALLKGQLGKMYSIDRERNALPHETPAQAPNECAVAESVYLSSACVDTSSTDTLEDSDCDVVIFGDGAGATANSLAVAQLAKSMQPTAIITAGDNAINTGTLFSDGDEGLLTDQVKALWQEWIERERWFPAWGNHDLGDGGLEGGVYGVPLMRLLPYVSDLNSSKKYYKITIGEASFFVLNSGYSDVDPREADGIGIGSNQVAWLTTELAASGSTWNIVVLHKSPYGSDTAYYSGDVTWRLDFRTLGADLVVSGHQHIYERLLVDRIPFIVCGLGGMGLRNFHTPVSVYSQLRYNSMYGCLRVVATSDSLSVAFINTNREIVDHVRFTA